MAGPADMPLQVDETIDNEEEAEDDADDDIDGEEESEEDRVRGVSGFEQDFAARVNGLRPSPSPSARPTEPVPMLRIVPCRSRSGRGQAG